MTQKKTAKTVALFTEAELEALETPREEFVVPGYAKAVEIRALNAGETKRYQAEIFGVGMDPETGKMTAKPSMERADVLLVALGMQTPKLEEAQVAALPADFVDKVATRIRELSKIDLTVEEAGND